MNKYEVIKNSLIYISNNYESNPSLNSLAINAGLSEFYFQKIFTKWAGISPKQFIQYLNSKKAKLILDNGGKVLDATYNTGLSSTSRLHDLFVEITAMTPYQYKNKGENLSINYSFNNSIFGNYLIASTNNGVCNIIFGEDEKTFLMLKNNWRNAKLFNKNDVFHEQVKNYIDKKLIQGEKIKLHVKGTNFQINIWEALLKIPEGKLVSYKNISQNISTKGYRATGTAIANNPIAYLIPCHRVIKETGEIGNYRWGKELKLDIISKELKY